MRKHVYIRLSIFFLLATLLVLSACSDQGGSASISLDSTDPSAPTATTIPFDPPEPTYTSEPTEPPAPTDSPEPTDHPEPTEGKPTKIIHPRLPVDRPDITMDLPEGDPERGAKLALARVCITCHLNGEGPPRLGADGELPAMLARAAQRIEDPAYTGTAATPEEYLFESITDPRIYEVDGDWSESMADDYYDFPEQDIADLIAWMLTIE